jgi:hypothetical protein
MPSIRSLLKTLVLIPVLFLVFGMSACGSKVAAFAPLTVLSIVGGNVQVLKAGSNDWGSGKEGMTLETGYKIKTDSGSKASITFFDGSVIELNGNTEISLDQILNKSNSSPKTIKIGQKIGETTSRVVKLVDPASRYEVDSPSGVAAVRGSTMVVNVTADGTTQVYNVEGTISLTAQGKEVAITAGSNSSAKVGEAPSEPQPGLPPGVGSSNANAISSRTGWQQTGLQLNAGDKFYVDYRGGSWSIDYRNFPYVGLAGYSTDIDKTIAVGYKFDSSLPYGYLLGKVGNGKEISIGNQGGPFTADASGYLSLRINDKDASLGDNDGSITLVLGFSKPSDKSSISTSCNATIDFSLDKGNPNGVWSYGWMPTDFSAFNIYTTHSEIQWYGPLGGDRTPCIWKQAAGTSYGVPSGWISLHPGPGTEPSILRWTAPKAGTIHVTGQFLAGDGGKMTIGIRKDNQEIWKAEDAGAFDIITKVATGSLIDFAVFGSYLYGNTPISAVIEYRD